MRIEDGGAQAAQAGAARQAQNTDEASGTDAKTSAKAPRRGDRVEISDVGRTLADGLIVGDVGDGEERSLSVEELQTLRERVTDGFYESSEVDEAIAKGILDSGEL